MNLIKEHIEYLKDNPEGYWFKRKLYGYGWTPAKLAGWLVVGLYVIFLLVVVWYVQAYAVYDRDEMPTTVIALIVLATALLLLVTWRTGEPLKWQWGQKHNSNKE